MSNGCGACPRCPNLDAPRTPVAVSVHLKTILGMALIEVVFLSPLLWLSLDALRATHPWGTANLTD